MYTKAIGRRGHESAPVEPAAPRATVQRRMAQPSSASSAESEQPTIESRGNFATAINAGIAVAMGGVEGQGGRLPHREPIQRSFGDHDVGSIRSYVGGAATNASDALGADAYAVGDAVGFRDHPDLHLAAHEAAHVVQQRGGVSLKGGVGEAGDAHERHADAVADRVVAGESAVELLSQYSATSGDVAVQLNPAHPRQNTRRTVASRVAQLMAPSSPVWHQINPHSDAGNNCPATAAALDLFLETGRIEPAPEGSETATFQSRNAPWRGPITAAQLQGLVTQNERYAVVEGTRPEAFCTANNITPNHSFIVVRHHGQLTALDAFGSGQARPLSAYLAADGFTSFRYYSARFVVTVNDLPSNGAAVDLGNLGD